MNLGYGFIETHIKKEKGVESRPISVKSYVEQASKFINPDLPPADVNSMLMGGIGTEAGEAYDHIKKYLFHGKELNKHAFALEVGDVLWYFLQHSFFGSEYCEALFLTTPARTPSEAWDDWVKYWVADGSVSIWSVVTNLVAVCKTYHYEWQQILSMNLEKLSKRYPDRLTASR